MANRHVLALLVSTSLSTLIFLMTLGNLERNVLGVSGPEYVGIFWVCFFAISMLVVHKHPTSRWVTTILLVLSSYSAAILTANVATLLRIGWNGLVGSVLNNGLLATAAGEFFAPLYALVWIKGLLAAAIYLGIHTAFEHSKAAQA